MLSDEEKKAIKSLKTEYEKLIKEGNILFPLYKSDAKRLIDIIEKQQKEIEELKEKNNYLPAWVNKKYISKDEIKAKIEEIDRKIEFEQNEKVIIYLHKQKRVLQSLLEKE